MPTAEERRNRLRRELWHLLVPDRDDRRSHEQALEDLAEAWLDVIAIDVEANGPTDEARARRILDALTEDAQRHGLYDVKETGPKIATASPCGDDVRPCCNPWQNGCAEC